MYLFEVCLSLSVKSVKKLYIKYLIKENQKEQLYSKLDANLKLALKTNLSN